ncbi:MAG: hypothetical protein ACKVP4_05780 [Hyphomicrobium sp.]
MAITVAMLRARQPFIPIQTLSSKSCDNRMLLLEIVADVFAPRGGGLTSAETAKTSLICRAKIATFSPVSLSQLPAGNDRRALHRRSL